MFGLKAGLSTQHMDVGCDSCGVHVSRQFDWECMCLSIDVHHVHLCIKVCQCTFVRNSAVGTAGITCDLNSLLHCRAVSSPVHMETAESEHNLDRFVGLYSLHPARLLLHLLKTC